MSAYFCQMLLILLTLNRRTKKWSALFLVFSIHLFIHLGRCNSKFLQLAKYYFFILDVSTASRFLDL